MDVLVSPTWALYPKKIVHYKSVFTSLSRQYSDNYITYKNNAVVSCDTARVRKRIVKTIKVRPDAIPATGRSNFEFNYSLVYI